MDERATNFAKTLAVLLDEIQRHEREPVESRFPVKAKGPRCYSPTEFEEAAAKGDFFMADPIGQALRLGVEHVGKLLAENGYDMGVMQDVAEQASANSGVRTDIVDKWWDGITLKDGSEWMA